MRFHFEWNTFFDAHFFFRRYILLFPSQNSCLPFFIPSLSLKREFSVKSSFPSAFDSSSIFFVILSVFVLTFNHISVSIHGVCIHFYFHTNLIGKSTSKMPKYVFYVNIFDLFTFILCVSGVVFSFVRPSLYIFPSFVRIFFLFIYLKCFFSIWLVITSLV